MLTRQNFQHACAPNNHTHVIKVGGENASDPRTAEWLATQSQNGERIAVAISALRTR